MPACLCSTRPVKFKLRHDEARDEASGQQRASENSAYKIEVMAGAVRHAHPMPGNMPNVSATCVSTTTVKQAAPKSTKNREAAYMGQSCRLASVRLGRSIQTEALPGSPYTRASWLGLSRP